MTQGKDKKKSTKINAKREAEKTCGDAELPQTAGEREKGKLVSCSGSLKVNSADVEVNQASLHGRPVSDEQPGSDELPTLLSLTIQRFEGETCEGQFYGKGVACFEGGHMYKGMFSKGLMDGPGVFTWTGGLKYEGEFVCNMPMGQGAYTWPDGSSYKGEVCYGVRHGTGTYKCAKTGVSYTGQWIQGKRHGKGAVYYNQDKTSWYQGDWVKNNREGLGVRCYPSGNIYSGEWKNNLRHGEGTMKWLKLGQQYVGMWKDGVQHGRGTHVWILRRADGSQYSQSNQYIGDFVQGQRHGQGTFSYPGGAIYEGEWKNDRKHGKGKFTFKNGHVFEGEFVDDQMMTPDLNGGRAPTPLCGALPLSGGESSALGPDMALNIESLLDKIPERKRDTERKQVEFVVLRKDAELRSIYSFYSRLGQAHSPDNTFLLSRLQLWRLLKDCNVHHRGVTLTQIDHFIKEDTATEIHSPFNPMPLCRLLTCLVIVAYHIYNKDMVSQKYLLAGCLSKLMTDDILPNAKNVKGFLFRPLDSSAVAMNYVKRCWEVYQAYCKVHASPRDNQTMTCRHLLWMFKDLRLLDNKLTTARLLKIITAESRDPNNLTSCMDLEITFLEFFEVLLGCAEVTCQRVSESLEEHQSQSGSNSETRRDLPEVEASEKILQTTSSPSQSVEALVNSPITPEISNTKSAEVGESSDTSDVPPVQDILGSQQDVKAKVIEQPQCAEHSEEHRAEGEDMQTRGMKARHQTVHQFFNHFFFPAFEHHRLVTENMKEDKIRQETHRRIALAKAQQRARQKEH